jgi:hypothetical protein
MAPFPNRKVAWCHCGKRIGVGEGWVLGSRYNTFYSPRHGHYTQKVWIVECKECFNKAYEEWERENSLEPEGASLMAVLGRDEDS